MPLTQVESSDGAKGARQERIPALLQAVFLQSNRGKEVHKPPPQRMGQRTFFRNWMFRNSNRYEKKTAKKTYKSSKDKLLTKQTAQEVSVQAKEETPVVAKTVTEYTLQEYFESLLKERGYDVKTYETLSTGYYHKATPLQVASYGPRMIQIVKSSDGPALRETLGCGLSPNPCNQFGESLLHMICRRGDIELLDVMIEAGSNLQMSDDYGRTCLHDACWTATPAFEVVKRVLARDSGLLFLKDKRGSLPLAYVHKADWTQWMEWLDHNVDHYFPESQAQQAGHPELALLAPNSVPVSENKEDLPLELIRMIANGDLSPQEATVVAESQGQDDQTEIEDFSESDSEFDSDCDSDFDSDDESDFDESEELEMMEMMALANSANEARPVGAH